MQAVNLDLNLPAYVIDTLLSPQDVSALGMALNHMNFDKHEIGHANSAHAHASVDFNTSFVETLPFFGQTAKFIDTIGYDTTLSRAYCNRLTLNDHTEIHVDCECAGDAMTLVVFVHMDWQNEWGGEFAFINQDDNSMLQISPVSGRALLFDGSLPHVGLPPNELAIVPRLSLVLKFGGQDVSLQ